MNRADWQRLANERLADAKALLAAKRWSASYYVAGYAVECGLKSCILARLTEAAEVIFEDKRFSEKCWTHVLTQLLELADLKKVFSADMDGDLDLRSNWEKVKEWCESSRYIHKSKNSAEEIFDAIADKKHGVFSWIKRRW